MNLLRAAQGALRRAWPQAVYGLLDGAGVLEVLEGRRQAARQVQNMREEHVDREQHEAAQARQASRPFLRNPRGAGERRPPHAVGGAAVVCPPCSREARRLRKRPLQIRAVAKTCISIGNSATSPRPFSLG